MYAYLCPIMTIYGHDLSHDGFLPDSFHYRVVNRSIHRQGVYSFHYICYLNRLRVRIFERLSSEHGHQLHAVDNLVNLSKLAVQNEVVGVGGYLDYS
jgi:hypothetical protein